SPSLAFRRLRQKYLQSRSHCGSAPAWHFLEDRLDAGGDRDSGLAHVCRVGPSAVALLEFAREAGADLLGCLRIDGKRPSRAKIHYLSVAHHKLTALEDEMRAAEHRRAVRLIRVNGDISERAWSEMSAIGQPKQ